MPTHIASLVAVERTGGSFGLSLSDSGYIELAKRGVQTILPAGIAYDAAPVLD